MKKVIFSAIMMMAFVGTSFGKTTKPSIKFKKKIELFETCDESATREVNRREERITCMTGDCFSDSYRVQLHNNLVAKCLEAAAAKK